MTQKLTAQQECWPIAGNFTISRGSKSETHVVVAQVVDGELVGRGECVPYARYGESVDSVLIALNAIAPEIAMGLNRLGLQDIMPPGAARNAIDCALLDLEAKRADCRVWELLGLPPLKPVETAYTISLDSPKKMAEVAANSAHHSLLKLKLGGTEDSERVHAIRDAVPNTRLIIDANEAWDESNIETLMHDCAEAGIELIEQPLPADSDAMLADIAHPVPICADESIHGLESLSAITNKYDAVNIKLDKTGGVTEALALAQAAEKLGLSIMVGCMLATSLAMAPALLIAQKAAIVDLDGPLLLARDRDPGLQFENSLVHPPSAELWG